MKISPAAKVGILTILALVVLIFGIMWLKGRTLASGESHSIKFNDVDGMRSGAMVQLMGLRVGQVMEVLPIVENDRSYVRVDFIITNKEVFIPQGSVISVQQSGLIGEKFLEITPPPIRTIRIPVQNMNKRINTGIPVYLIYEGNKYEIGEVRSSRIISQLFEEYKRASGKGVVIVEKVRYFHEIGYIITRAGLDMPPSSDFVIDNDASSITVYPPPKYIVHIPPATQKFTTEDPLRLKEFMELQVQSAEALKATNDKINLLLQPEQIYNLRDTLKNTRILTARAADIIQQANDLMASSKGDLRRLVDSSTNLTNNLVLVSNNINDIIGDPNLRTDIKETVQSIRKSTNELNTIISDPNIRETISLARETTQNVNELVTYVKGDTEGESLTAKLDCTITNLNESLNRLSMLVERTDKMAATHEDNVNKIINESTEISENMKKFSKKLNKHFLLFRLLF